jgi:hypothetical protein
MHKNPVPMELKVLRTVKQTMDKVNVKTNTVWIQVKQQNKKKELQQSSGRNETLCDFK